MFTYSTRPIENDETKLTLVREGTPPVPPESASNAELPTEIGSVFPQFAEQTLSDLNRGNASETH